MNLDFLGETISRWELDLVYREGLNCPIPPPLKA
jgi:hypothetical protein